jgi:hypothetical protein
MRLDFAQCRNFGAGLPSATRGVQLGLFVGYQDPVPGGQCCEHCGRAVLFWVRFQGKTIGLCNWHATGRFPLNVRRQSFAHFRGA